MTEFFEKLFSSDFMPHVYCYLWKPDIVWLHAVSDGLIALSHFAIPLMLVYFVRKRSELRNALDAIGAAEDSAELSVLSSPNGGDQVKAAVRDSGVGIQPDDLDRLFNPLFTTRPQGMGMGLPISRSIIEAHGGRLWAAPNEGPGSTFTFTLPATS